MVYATLCANQATQNGVLAEDILATSGYPRQLRVESDKNVTRCVLTTNQGEVLDYRPGQGNIARDIDAIDYYGMCSVTIRSANRTHAGIWQIKAKTAPDDGYRTNTHDDNATAEKTFAFNLYVQVNLVLHRPRPVLSNFVGHRMRRARGDAPQNWSPWATLTVHCGNTEVLIARETSLSRQRRVTSELYFR